jgi:rhamnulokinase
MGTRAKVIAMDIGASGAKCFAALFDENGLSLREIHRFSHEPTMLHIADRTGGVEERSCWDDLFIYAQLLEGLRCYRREVGRTADSIGIDTWGSDGILVTADGMALGPMYCYRDHRLDGMVDKVKARIPAARIYEITGIHFQPFNISNQLMWFMEHRGDAVRRGARFLPLPTVFSWYLGGVVSVDSSWASVTQLMDARTRRWSPEILRALGIPSRIMPPIVAPGTVVGRLHAGVAESVDMDPVPLVAVGSHDTASAYAAAPVVDPSHALIISSGTWSLIGMLVETPITGADAMAANISNEGGIGNVRLLKNCMGTWLVQELRRGWRRSDRREMSWEEMNRLCAQAAPFAAFIDPDDPGFYNPPDMESAIIAYIRRTGQRVPVDRGALLRAVYESLAFTYRLVADQIARISGARFDVVHIVGGGSRNAFLNQAAANACGLKVVAGPEEATAVGNALVQALGLGVFGKLTDATPMIRSAFPISEFVPRDVETWSRETERFRALVRPV